jgi:WG containing repeat
MKSCWIRSVSLLCLTLVISSLSSIGSVKLASSNQRGYEWTKTTAWKGSNFSEGLVRVCYQDPSGRKFKVSLNSDFVKYLELCGHMNREGDLVINPTFHDAGDFHEGVAWVQLNQLFTSNNSTVIGNGRYGFIDKSGEIVISLMFDAAGNFNEGLAPVQFNGMWGYINKKGGFTISPRFIRAGEFHEGIASVVLSGSSGKSAYINKTGKILRTFISNGSKFSEGLIVLPNNNGKYGYMNNKGEIIISYQFDAARSFSEGLAAIYKKSASIDQPIFSGYINTTGNIVISSTNLFSIKDIDANPNIDANEFSEGLALIENRNKKHECIYVNKKGQIAFKILNAKCGSFSGGLALVNPYYKELESYDERNNKNYFIDKTGRTVIPSSGYRYKSFQNGLAGATRPDKKYFDSKRKIYVMYYSRYDSELFFDSGGKIVFQSPLKIYK